MTERTITYPFTGIDSEGKKYIFNEEDGTFYGLQIGHDHTGYEKILDRIWRI